MVITRCAGFADGKIAVGEDDWVTGERVGGVQQKHRPIGVAVLTGQPPLRVLENERSSGESARVPSRGPRGSRKLGGRE